MADPAPAPPGAAGVPLVDLTALLADTYQRADDHRTIATTLEGLAAGQRRTADHLETLAAVLTGTTP